MRRRLVVRLKDLTVDHVLNVNETKIRKARKMDVVDVAKCGTKRMQTRWTRPLVKKKVQNPLGIPNDSVPYSSDFVGLVTAACKCMGLGKRMPHFVADPFF